MPQVTVEVGGRAFDVACHDGEEPYLKAAAALLDAEASTLLSSMGRMPETTMLLMAGLMLADKTAAQEDRVRRAEARASALETRITEIASRPSGPPIEVPMVPRAHVEALQAMAAQAEAIAEALEGEEAP